MNIQTERLENHTARLTVELTTEYFERAKKNAATKLSSRYKIPGFRKGKAPYNVVVKFLGEASILEEAVELMADDIYPKALAEADLRPYAPGKVEDFKLDPVPTYTFTLPLQPEVNLKDYRSARVEFVTPTVTEEDLEKVLEALRQQEAATEDSTEAIVEGQRVTVDIHSHFEDGEERPEETDDDDEETEAASEPEETILYKGDEFLHRHDAVITVTPENDEIFKGFAPFLLGAKVGDDVEFDMTIPEDFGDANLVGRTVHFEVQVKKVQTIQLPELNDEFAQKLTADEPNPLNLEQLKERMLANMQREAEGEYNNKYSDMVIDKIMEDADIAYPEAMVIERINEMIDNFDNYLKRQHLSLEVYQSITGIGEEQLANQYRPEAEKYVKRSLILGEILVKEKVGVSDSELTEQVDAYVREFGGNAKVRRQLTSKDELSNITSQLLFTKVMERLIAIGKGESIDNGEATA